MSGSQIVRSEHSGSRARGSRMAIVAVALALVAGCGGTAAPAGSGAGASTPAGGAGQPTAAGNPTPGHGGQAVVTGDDVCKLIPDSTWDALGAALKVKFLKDPNSTCRRESEDTLSTASVEFVVGRDAIKSMNSICTGVQPISGLGDEAVWCSDFKSLTAYANGQTIALQLFLFSTGAASADAALAAAKAFISAVIPIVPKGETPIAGNPADNKACTLTNAQELEAALGEPFDPPTITTEVTGGSLACGFDRRNAIGSVAVRLFPDATQYEATKKALAPDVEDVSGIGDKAYWSAGLKLLEAVCGGHMLDIQIVFLDKDSPALKTAAENLTKAACSRI